MNQAITELRTTWEVLFPEVPAPMAYQWQIWLMLHEEQTVKRGIAELAAKYRKLGGNMDTDYMIKFASSVMNRADRDLRTSIQ